MRRVILDTGHGQDNGIPGVYDPGARCGIYEEATYVRHLAQGVLGMLGEEAVLAPQGNLRYVRIPWQRRHVGGDDVFVSLHLNAGGGTGTEVLYSSGRPELSTHAALLSVAVASGLGLRDRGPRPDSQSVRGRVGILHHPVGIVLLLEAGFIDSPADMLALEARGAGVIAEALRTLFLRRTM